jgi:hypothetical protein
MKFFQKLKHWLLGAEPAPDPVLQAIMRLPLPGPTGPRYWKVGPTGACPYGPMTGAVVVVDDTSDCLTVAAAAAVAAMVIESTPPACPYCETAIPPAPMPSTDTPLEASSPSSDTPDCGGSCDCSCGGDQ